MNRQKETFSFEIPYLYQYYKIRGVMATPITPAPASAAKPTPLAPALACKPPSAAASVSSPGPGTPGSITSREWVIPPRPKPGRKPAMDTPPTKRKAQNRAAQRAFRERRAARVGELEEQMKQVEDENDAHVAELKNEIASLSSEVNQCRREIDWWRDRCAALEKQVSANEARRDPSSRQMQSGDVNVTGSGSSGELSLSSRNSRVDRHMDGQNTNPNPPSSGNVNEDQGGEDVPLGCSRCSFTHCQCIEDAFTMPGVESYSQNPNSSGSREQQYREPQIKPEPEEMEIDFTSRFLPTQPQADNSSVSSPAVDPCGFCQDGTPCICAEVAAQEEQRQNHLRHDDSFDNNDNNRLAPIQNLSQFTPPPSDSDARSEVTLPPISQATNPCANGPGTCAQCQSDPRSTLFCKSLAASRSVTSAPAPAPAANASSGGCCGGKGVDGGCCQSRNNNPTNINIPAAPRAADRLPPPSTSTSTSDPSSSLTVSCADAFTTLSRHPNFSRASDELDTWLPRLHTLPDPRRSPMESRLNSRATMEVEAASVMGVLRYFDRRFADK